MACEENEEDDAMSIKTIADILVYAPFEEVSEVTTEDDESFCSYFVDDT